jgi:uncharacterized protein YqgC (DUF456 family)
VSGTGLFLVGLAMAVGLVGIVVPVLPGLPVIWGAGLVWALAEDGAARWLVLAVLTVLLAVGTVARYVLAARSMGGKVPRLTMLAAAVGGVVGMVVIPVVGMPVGGVVGVYVAELRRTGNRPAAWASTKKVMLAFGIGMAVELAAGIAMVVTWGVAVAAT